MSHSRGEICSGYRTQADRIRAYQAAAEDYMNRKVTPLTAHSIPLKPGIHEETVRRQ